MEIIKVNEKNEDLLYKYIQKFQGQVPYYFQTPLQLLKTYMNNDTLMGHSLMQTNKLYMALEGEICCGMIQFGIQGVDYSETGEFLVQPNTGNIRHLLFEKDSDVGTILLKVATDYFQSLNIKEYYAFNHVAGLSCYSKHGKLHESMNHVHELLLINQLKVRHENIYYILEIESSELLKETEANNKEALYLEVKQGEDRDYINLIDRKKDNQVVGVSEVTKLSLWSEEASDPNLYMRYIHIDPNYRGKGYSKKFISKISTHYKQEGIEFIHTDTSLYNEVAQNLYHKLGFKYEGITRDYKYLESNYN